MEASFNRLLEENTPKANPFVMNGLACHYLKEVEGYIDAVMRSAAKSFPPQLTYEGYERCTPHEEFNEVTKVRNNKRIFNLAHSDLYMVKYKFKHNGVRLPDRFICLPFVVKYVQRHKL